MRNCLTGFLNNRDMIKFNFKMDISWLKKNGNGGS